MRIGVGLSIPELSTRGGRFSPAALFADGAKGVWYAPDDFSTLFQDSAGTTPVTAVEQPVGLMLDKSQGLVLGSELFESSTPSGTGWTGTNATASGNVVTFSAQFANRRNPTAATSDKWYRYTFTARRISGNTALQIFHENSLSGDYTAFTATGTATTYQVTVRGASGGTINFGVQDRNASGFGDLEIYDLSVKELAGNHASQATTASRPVLRARYNLLTYSEQFTNSVWTSSATNATATADQATAPNGTVTADLMQATAAGANAFLIINPSLTSGVAYTTSIYVKRVNADWFALSNSAYFAYFNISAGTVGSVGEGSASITDVGSGWWRIVWSGQTNVSTAARIRAVTANNNPNVSGGEQYYIWGADLRTGSSAGTYQRIAAATDYATAGFLPYLALDGTDDSFGTGSIDFSTTDKMYLCAGVTKLGTSASILAELSANIALNAGSFYVGPNVDGSTTYTLALQGTAGCSYAATSYSAPITNTISVQYNIGGSGIADEIVPKVNGATPTLAATGANAGTGNFGNYPLYIGRRNNASLPLNGRIYQMIVCGKALSASELASTEAFVNTKTGAY